MKICNTKQCPGMCDKCPIHAPRISQCFTKFDFVKISHFVISKHLLLGDFAKFMKEWPLGTQLKSLFTKQQVQCKCCCQDAKTMHVLQDIHEKHLAHCFC